VAWSKVLVENGTGKILGAHLAGHGAEEVIHIFAFAMRFGVPASDLSSSVYADPTFMSDVKTWFDDPGQPTSMASTFVV